MNSMRNKDLRIEISTHLGCTDTHLPHPFGCTRLIDIENCTDEAIDEALATYAGQLKQRLSDFRDLAAKKQRVISHGVSRKTTH